MPVPIESLIKETQQAYYDALEAAGNRGESTPFIEFMLKAILKTCEDELKNRQDGPINIPIKRLDGILLLIAENAGITIEQLVEYCDVSEKAA